MSTAYHPQTNGQTECVNQILEQYFQCYVNYNLSDWPTLLSLAEFAYSNAAHEGTKHTPFFLEYGRQYMYYCKHTFFHFWQCEEFVATNQATGENAIAMT